MSSFFSKIFQRGVQVAAEKEEFESFRQRLHSVDEASKNSSFHTATHRRAYSSTIETSKICVRSTTASLSSLKEPMQINQYLVLGDIGAGSYGSVKRCKNTENEKFYAVKVISKNWMRRRFKIQSFNRSKMSLNGSKDVVALDDDPLYEIKKEIAILKKVSNHPSIVSLIEVLDDQQENNLYLGTCILTLSV